MPKQSTLPILAFLLSLCTFSVNSFATPLAQFLHRNEDLMNHLPAKQTPYQRSGKVAFSVFDQAFCSPQLAHQVMLADRAPKLINGKSMPARVLDPADAYQYVNGKNQRKVINVGQQTELMLSNFNAILNQFIANGDQIVANNHICVGFMDTYEADAQSHLQGYILFDPRIYQRLDEFDTNMASQLMVEMHELAHQIQYWQKMRLSRDPATKKLMVSDIIGPFVKNDKTVKRFEMTADCMAAAMTEMRFPINQDFMLGGMQMAGVAYGDFDEKARKHHGTPLHRAIAVSKGVELIKNQRVSNPKLANVQSLWVMESCENEVANLKLIGERLKG